MTKRTLKILALSLLLAACIPGLASLAQDMVVPEPETAMQAPVAEAVIENMAAEEAVMDLTPKKTAELTPASMPSMFYTYWEHEALRDAKRTRGSVRPPTQSELNAEGSEQGLKPPPEEREVKLGGIVFTTGSDWTIWLNGKRITPKAVPSEALDLRVHKEFIEIKWFDSYTNQIFPLRLRPHQRFNLDSRIFLPG